MIRAYITKWWVVDPDGLKIGMLNRPTPAELAPHPSRQIMHPILRWQELNPSAQLQLNMHFPDADHDGLPDKDYLLVLAESAAEITALKSLTGVWMFPPNNLGRAIAELTTAQREAGFAITDLIGAMRESFTGTQNCGEFLKRVARFISPNHGGFGAHIEARAGEFE